MANWADFTIHARGPYGQLHKLLKAFERRKVCTAEEGTPWVFDFGDLEHVDSHRTSFWSPENWFRLDGELLCITGEMNGAHPLEIIAAMKILFPDVAFSCLSNTEYEWLEHWGFGESDELHPIEEIRLDARTKTVLQHFLKVGATTEFRGPFPAESFTR